MLSWWSLLRAGSLLTCSPCEQLTDEWMDILNRTPRRHHRLYPIIKFTNVNAAAQDNYSYTQASSRSLTPTATTVFNTLQSQRPREQYLVKAGWKQVISIRSSTSIICGSRIMWTVDRTTLIQLSMWRFFVPNICWRFVTQPRVFVGAIKVIVCLCMTGGELRTVITMLYLVNRLWGMFNVFVKNVEPGIGRFVHFEAIM